LDIGSATRRSGPRKRYLTGRGMPASTPNSLSQRGELGGSPWKLGGLSLRNLARRVWKEVWEDEILDRSSALSYYFVFALFPALLFMTALLGLLPTALVDELMGYFDRVLPGDTASLVRKTLGEIVQGASPTLLSVGIATALWAASNGMAAIMTTLNIAYGIEDRRPWWKQRLVAIALTVGFSLFVSLALLLLMYGERIGHALAGWVGLGSAFTVTWALLQWPVAVLLVLTGTGLAYSVAPATRRRWHWVTPGSAFAVFGWLLISLGLRAYVKYFADYNITYGSIGGVILLMTWFYLTGVVLLIGAEIDSEIDQAQTLTVVEST